MNIQFATDFDIILYINRIGVQIMDQNVAKHSPGYSKLACVFDEGTFVELGAYVKRKGSDSEYEGVICGYGAIDGRLVFAFSQDTERLEGAVDEYHAKKIENLYSAAMKNCAPVVGIFESNGATIKNGFSANSAYGRIIKCVSDASGVIPQLAIINGACVGSMAAVACMFDASFFVKASGRMYIASPASIGEKYGNADFLAENGLVSSVSDSFEDAVASLKKIVAMLPDNCGDVAVNENEDLPERETVISENIHDTINSVADKDSFVELCASYAKNMITGLATMSGITVGIVANNPSKADGRISANGANKAAAFVSFCDSFGIPVITFVDSCGAELTAEAEDQRIAAALAKYALAYSSATVSKICLVIGKAYGAATVFMGSKALGTDVVFALHDTVIGALSPEASVAFFENDKIKKDSDREMLEAKWRKEILTPENAAADGGIDDIIDASEARARICSALNMLLNSGRSLKRKHINAVL